MLLLINIQLSNSYNGLPWTVTLLPQNYTHGFTDSICNVTTFAALQEQHNIKFCIKGSVSSNI